jgi:pilus assembly protein CpaB
LKRSNRVLLLLGVVLAAVAFMGVLAVGAMGQTPPPQVATVTVVVAAHDLPIGTQLTADMLSTEERPVPQATDTYRTPGELNGTIIRRSVSAGHVLRTTDFDTGTPAAEVAGSIASGLRGIAVSLDQVDGIAYLVQPGDFVDVVLTMADATNPVAVTNPKYPTEAENPLILLDDWTNNTSVKVLVQNVQVVATLDPRASEAGNDVTAGGTTIVPVMVAVLAVSPQQAELVRFAQITGDVSLVLRSPADRTAGEVATTGITLRELVDRHGVLPPAPVAP